MSYESPHYMPRIVSRTADRRAAGACRGLSGNVFVTFFFLDDPKTRWTERQVCDYFDRNVHPSVKYLEDHAAQWQIPLKITVGYYCTGQTDGFTLRWPEVLSGSFTEDTRGLVRWCVEQTNYDSINALSEYLSSDYDSEHVLYAVVLNKPGRCCAVSSSRWHTPSEREYMLLFNQTSNSTRPEYPCAVAHEMLHQFGAIDLYFPDDPTEERLGYTKALFPNDIMYRVDPAIDKLQIGAVTAHMIGWLQDLPERYGSASWWEEDRRKKQK